MNTDLASECVKKRPRLIYDEACLDIENQFTNSVSIYAQISECESCDFIKLVTLNGSANASVLLKTKYTIKMYYDNSEGTFCDWSQVFREHYRYGWNISQTCEKPFVKESAPSAYIPIICAIIAFIFLKMIWYLVERLYESFRNLNVWRRYNLWLNPAISKEDLSDPAEDFSLPLHSGHTKLVRNAQRIKSIDVFRGCCIVLMIFINYGGGYYWFFQHYLWNGFTVADAIMPWFTWVMGLSLSLSISRKIRAKVPRRILYYSVIRRSAILILLGVVKNSFRSFTYLKLLRFPGVLQRLGVDYLIVGLLEVTFAEQPSLRFQSPSLMQLIGDVLPSYPQWICVIFLAGLNVCVTFLLPMPGEGCHPGYLGPGGLHNFGKHHACTGGAAGYIDRLVFGEHILKHIGFQSIYTIAEKFDSQGILGTLNSILLVYFGVQAGKTLQYYKSSKKQLIRWFGWGIVTCLLSGVLSNFSFTQNAFIPINRNLLSLSFVLLMAGIAFFVQALLYIAVDLSRIWNGNPLAYPGMNSILLYLLHEVFFGTLPFAWTPEIRTHASYLCMNIWATVLWVLFSIYLYRRKFFVSI